jgi:hypothetical protein
MDGYEGEQRSKPKCDAERELRSVEVLLGGYHGLLVRSFAPGATTDDLNLVLWKWGHAAPARGMQIDDVVPALLGGHLHFRQ